MYGAHGGSGDNHGPGAKSSAAIHAEPGAQGGGGRRKTGCPGRGADQTRHAPTTSASSTLSVICYH